MGETGVHCPLDRPLVLATGNPGKLSELAALLGGFSCDIKGLRDFGPIPPCAETGATFEDNAVLKARFTARVLGFPALADDSGLVVKALDGAPGVRSARFAGPRATDEENVRRLLEAMKGVKDREASFQCILALAVPRGPALLYEGTCTGWITEEPAGTDGFGYDPVFFYPPLQKTFAQLSREEKNRVSHRGKALHEFVAEFDKVLLWLRQRLSEEPQPGQDL